MLNKLRKKKNAKKIWIVLSILILPAFIFWGSGSLIRSKQEAVYVGEIFGRKIPFLEFQDSLNAVRNQAIIQFGDNLSEIQKYLNLESQAWDRLILLAEAKKRKISVSDKEVIEAIKNYPFFQRKGQFDNQIYTEVTQYVFRTQSRIFEEQTRQSLILSKLYKDTTDSITLSEEEINKEYRKLNEQISLYYIASLLSDFVKDIAPSEEEIKDYFTKNSLQFKQPLSFNLEYISLTAEGKNEEAMKEEINKLIARINKKEALTKLAKDLNLEVKETGLFRQTDPIPGIGWAPQILSLLDKAKADAYLPLAKVDKNYYLLRLKERKEPYIPDFETAKDKVKETFIKEKSREIARQKIENCLKELKMMLKVNPKSIDFDKVAGIFGLKSSSTGLFQYGSYIEGIGASDIFFMQAQNFKEDEFSDIIDMGLSGFYIIKLKSKVPIDETKFAAEKTEFAQKSLLQKKQEYFAKTIEILKEKAKGSFKGVQKN